MCLRPGLLWLTLNLALIIESLSRNNTHIFLFQFYKLNTTPLLPLGPPEIVYKQKKTSVVCVRERTVPTPSDRRLSTKLVPNLRIEVDTWSV
jgi:hypothetical protein